MSLFKPHVERLSPAPRCSNTRVLLPVSCNELSTCLLPASHVVEETPSAFTFRDFTQHLLVQDRPLHAEMWPWAGQQQVIEVPEGKGGWGEENALGCGLV